MKKKYFVQYHPIIRENLDSRTFQVLVNIFILNMIFDYNTVHDVSIMSYVLYAAFTKKNNA